MANVYGHYLKDLSSWRKMAAVGWKPPNDPAIYGGIKVNFSAARAYLKEHSARCNLHLTPVHLVTKAVAETLRRHPECNGLIRGNRIFLRDHVDISVLVAVYPDDGHDQKADLSETILRDADQKSIEEVGQLIAKGAKAIRTNTDPFLQRTKSLFNLMPSFLLKYALRLTAVLEYRLNWNLQRFGVPRDPFGSMLITNVGSFGITQAWAPIPPFSRVPALISVGKVEDEPVAVDGRIEIQPLLPLYATLDHRLIDGFQGARIGKTLRQIIEHPFDELDAHHH